MSARDAILAAARRNAPAAVPLPAIPEGRLDGDPVARFAAAVEAAGGRVIESTDAGAGIEHAYPEAVRVVSEAEGVDAVRLGEDARAVAEADVFVCEAVLGVAENGAVWLPESRLGARVAPFLAPHVAVVLNRSEIVTTMHDAYARLGETDASGPEAGGFGVFVAGPSKTADIEQSLVVGAHGPLSLTVVVVP